MSAQSATIAGSGPKPNSFLVRSSIISALGGLLFGFDTVVIAGTTAAARRVFELPGWIHGVAAWFGQADPREVMVGVYVFSGLVGTIVGAAAAGWPADKFGRRASLRGLALMYVASAIGCAGAWNWTSLLGWRVIAGLAIGASSVIGPMYIAEIAPAKWRGRLAGLFQFNIVSGILLAFLSNYFVGLGSFGDAEWRVKLGVAAIPAIAFLLLLLLVPRSPRWLVMRGQVEEARSTLTRLGEPDPEAEVRAIQQAAAEQHQRLAEPLFRAKYRFPIFLAVTIGFFNQMTGINALLYYVNDIFRSAGFSAAAADKSAIIIGFANFASTIIALSVIDRLGRKKLLLIGAAGCSACLAIASAYYFGKIASSSMMLFAFVAFIAFFAFSQGAVIWVYLGEVFPNAVRGKGQSLGSFTHWFMNALISLLFPILAAKSRGSTFALFAGATAVQFLVVMFLYPETKGITLEDMQRKLGLQ